MDKVIMPSLNKKICGATKVEQDGVKFDSKLEMAMFHALSSSKIPFTYKEKIVLIQGFKYGDKHIRQITWQPDFFIPYLKIVLDTKGYSNDVAPLKIKLCKYWLFNQGLLDWQIWIVKKKSEIVECIELLKVYKTGQKNKFEV